MCLIPSTLFWATAGSSSLPKRNPLVRGVAQCLPRCWVARYSAPLNRERRARYTLTLHLVWPSPNIDWLNTERRKPEASTYCLSLDFFSVWLLTDTTLFEQHRYCRLLVGKKKKKKTLVHPFFLYVLCLNEKIFGKTLSNIGVSPRVFALWPLSYSVILMCYCAGWQRITRFSCCKVKSGAIPCWRWQQQQLWPSVARWLETVSVRRKKNEALRYINKLFKKTVREISTKPLRLFFFRCCFWGFCCFVFCYTGLSVFEPHSELSALIVSVTFYLVFFLLPLWHSCSFHKTQCIETALKGYITVTVCFDTLSFFLGERYRRKISLFSKRCTLVQSLSFAACEKETIHAADAAVFSHLLARIYGGCNAVIS